MDQRPALRPKTIKLLEKNIRGQLHYVELGKDFLDSTLKAHYTKKYSLFI
jgi:hypothetical protein